MKTPALILITAFIAFNANAQYCDFIKSYFGADFGISLQSKSQNESSKENGLHAQSIAMAVKGGIRIIPMRSCDKGLKYLAEAEIRSDNWQDFLRRGTSASVLGGVEKWFGQKGYINILAGINVPFSDSVSFIKGLRPYTALRIGHGQFYLQPIYIPRIYSKSSKPSMIYFTIGFKNFSYAGVRYKKQSPFLIQ